MYKYIHYNLAYDIARETYMYCKGNVYVLQGKRICIARETYIYEP